MSNAADYKLIFKSHDNFGVNNTEVAIANPDAWKSLKYYKKFSEGSDGEFKLWLNG